MTFGCFHLLHIINNPAMSFCIQDFVWTKVFSCFFSVRSGIDWWYGDSLPFLRPYWKNVYSFAYFWIGWFLLLSCKNSFCVLDISPISDTWFAVFFPHFVSCFSLSYSVFEVQMFLILMRSNLLLVLLVSYLRIHCPI